MRKYKHLTGGGSNALYLKLFKYNLVLYHKFDKYLKGSPYF